MASTATASSANVSSASQRNKKLSPSSSSPSPAPPTKLSHRQAKPYKPEELHQFKVPDLTVKDLLSAIPAHCFKRSAVKSFAYVIQDFVLTAILIYAASFIDPTLKAIDFSKSPLTPFISASTQYSLSRFSIWALYSVAQGLVWTGLWVIAHECGHQGFSESKTLNNTVGWVLHSALLVPYHSWRISHARHHAATGHLTRDEVFVPRTRAQKGLLPLKPAEVDQVEADQVDASLSADSNKTEQLPEQEPETWGEWLAETLEDAPLYNFIFVLVQQLLGWPLYLIQNSSGQVHYPKGTNHFNPDSIIFDARHRQQVIVSDIGMALTISALVAWGNYSSGGFGEVMRYYGVPYLWVNNWLVMITYLQHTDPLLPHYKAEAWTFPRGALCTVDRSWLGPVGPYLLHGIAETHVAHHVSSKIPHYNAWEATEALKERLGPHYQFNSDNIFVALWKTVRNCKFVEENDQVAFYRNAHGVPKATVSADSSYNSDSGLAMSE